MKLSQLAALLSVAALATSAQGALTVFLDDFEGPTTVTDENIGALDPAWTATGAAFTGRFNADDDTGTEWYHGIAGFEDDTGGEVGTMDGPTKGTIFAGGSDNSGGDSIRRDIGTIEADTIYDAVLSLSGSRTAPNDAPLGYSIDLMAGATVLASTVGTAADAAALLFGDDSVSFDSSLNPAFNGQTLSFRIMTLATPSVGATGYYIDFDNARFSETLVPEPSHSLLLALAGAGLLIRRRRK